MKAKRKRHSAAFKAKVGFEALVGLKTVSQLAREYVVHPTQVTQWRATIRDHMPELFEPGQPGTEDQEQLIAQFYQPVGVAVDASGQVYVSDFYNSRIRLLALTPAPSILTQTGLTGTNSLNVSLSVTGLVANTTYYYRALATNSLGTVAGQTLSFTTPGQDTTVELASNLNPAPYGSNVTFTATVLTSAATGTVSFLDGTNTLGMVTLSGGVATFTTNGLTAGSHSIAAAYSGDASYGASPSSALNQTVNQAAATVVLGSLAQTYTGSAISATAATTPAGLPVSFTYNGSAVAPTNFGSYTVIGTVGDASYAGSADAPTNAGSYTVVATIADVNCTGSTTNVLVINQATPGVTTWPAAGAITYGQTLASSTLSGGSAGVDGTFAWATPGTTPAAGTAPQSVTFTPGDAANFVSVSGSASVTVNQAALAVVLDANSLSQTYDGTAKSVIVLSPANLLVDISYDRNPHAPAAAGSYPVVATISDANYTGSATNTLVINQALAMVTLDNLNQTYDGTGKAVTVTTDPANLAANVTYDGSVNAPTNVASYTVIGTITDPNYIGSATNTLVVDDVVVVCFPVQNGLWSDPATWQGGVVPPDGSDVFIPADLSVTVDVATSALGNVTVAGTLSLGSNLLTVSGNYINNGTVNPGTGTVVLVGSSNQVLAATAPGSLTFYKLTVNKTPATATVTATSKLKATKKLTITSGKLISASDYGDVLIETAGAIELTSDITIAGDLVIQGEGTLTTAGNKVTFDGGTNQNLTTEFLVQFDDLTVSAGTTLIETESANNVVVNGTLLNQGVIRKTQALDAGEWYYFGLAGNYASADMEIHVTDRTGGDPITAIQVDRVDANPPNAPGTNTTGIYWTITPTGSDFVASVALPQDGLDDPQVCRYRNSAWDWARSAFDPNTVTRTGLTAFGEFAVLNNPQVAASTTTTLAASLNPSTPGQSVTFTATVTPSAATGTVTFKDGATTLGAGTLSSGTATYATAVLSAGSHSITAEYAGDSSYLAGASAAVSQVVNTPPTASGFAMGGKRGVPSTVAVIGGKHPPADVDSGDAATLHITAVTQGSHGIVSTDGTNVTYTGTGGDTGTDSFTYTVTDRYGGTAVATVTVSIPGSAQGFNLVSATQIGGSQVRLTYMGVPGHHYVLDRTDNLAYPIHWIPQATNLANGVGQLIFTNLPDAATNNFWRTRYLP